MQLRIPTAVCQNVHYQKLKACAVSRVQRYDDANSARSFGISEAGKALNVGHKQIPVKLNIITLDVSFSSLSQSCCHDHLGYNFRVICEYSSEAVSTKTIKNASTSHVDHPLTAEERHLRQLRCNLSFRHKITRPTRAAATTTDQRAFVSLAW